MKKKGFIPIAVVCIGFSLFYSCAKHTAAKQNATDFDKQVTGSDFAAFGLAGIFFSDALDTVGKWHNDYQDYMLKELVSRKINLRDTTSLKLVLNEQSAHFFAKKGIHTTATNSFQTLRQPDKPFSFDSGKYSAAGVSILSRIKKFMEEYDENDDRLFFDSLQQLKREALQLGTTKEIFTVGIPVSVAIHSFAYWKENAYKWITLLEKNIEGYQTTAYKCHVKLARVGAYDVTGGIGGAMNGTVLGPGGALAGGILGSSSASLIEILDQAFSCLFDWW